MTIMTKPDSDYCYETYVFSEGKQCPDLDDDKNMEPKCRKYNQLLSWNRSGTVLKCKECKEEEGELCPA